MELRSGNSGPHQAISHRMWSSSYVHYPIFEGWKRYELTNHLGNVLAVITDRKRGNAVSGTAIQWFEADVVAAQQYYPFGMLMPGNTNVGLRRQYTLNSFDYRYGFNGKEGDDEVKGDDNQQDYGMRIYDTRVARFLSVDPLAKTFPFWSPFAFAGNTPIQAVDLDGKEIYGYLDLAKEKAFVGALKIANENQVFINYLQTTFENIQDVKSDKFGAKVNGKYSDVPIHFEGDKTINESTLYFENGVGFQGDSHNPSGKTSIGFTLDGVFIDILDLSNRVVVV